MAYLARSKALASIQQCLNVVRLVHMNLGYPNPVAGCHQLQTVLTGIKRVKGTAAAYKLPFNPSHLTAIKSHLNLTCVVDACFFAIITTCFFGLVRIGNVTVSNNNWHNCILRCDISFLKNGATLVIRASKTIQFKERLHKAVLPVFPSHPLCPVQAIKDVLDLAGPVPPSAPLFSYWNNGRLVMPLASVFRRKLSVSLNFIDAGGKAEFSTHSLRRGGASWLLSVGVPVETIKVLGDWKSNAVFKYLLPSDSQRLQMLPRTV